MPKNWTRSVAGMQNRYGLMDKLVFEACVLAEKINVFRNPGSLRGDIRLKRATKALVRLPGLGSP